MKRINPRSGRRAPINYALIGFLSGFLLLGACGPISVSLPSTQTTTPIVNSVKWVDWNVLFKSTASKSYYDTALDRIEDSIVRFVSLYNQQFNRHDSVYITRNYCPCDPLLYNIVASVSVSASGLIATKPTPPPTTGAGDPVQYDLQNSALQDVATRAPSKTSSKFFENYSLDSSRILAVMDTGLDSALFELNFRKFIWQDQNVPTLRNFLLYDNGKPADYYYDDDSFKHGSAVTSLILESLGKTTKSRLRPRVMVLKVLDSNRSGSVFTVSCALSYAMQNRATLVNASLGYYGSNPVDSILLHYVNLCKKSEIQLPIIAAAGNLPGEHNDNLLCSPLDPANRNMLTDSNMFFPGCLSAICGNVVCVTGLQSENMPCFYQNYASKFVSIGVITNPGDSPFCCNFPVRFFNQPLTGYEGSSFATPIISGQILGKMIITHTSDWRAAYNQIGTVSAGPTAKKITTYISIP